MEEEIQLELKQTTSIWKKLLPLTLMIAVFVLDQLTKWLVIKNIQPYTVGYSFFDGVLRIIHVYNTGAAFSMGQNLAENVKSIVLGIIPLLVLIMVLVIYFRSNDFTTLQRWAIAGVVGGGLGNLYDRFFRSAGVVDFIDVKFYGLFGLERWPTFNVADSVICICAGILIVSFVRAIIREEKQKNKEIDSK